MVAHSLAKEFHKIFHELGDLEEYSICRHILQLTNFEKIEHGVSDDCVRGMLKLDGLLQINHNENIKHILLILEDSGIIYDQHIQLLWVGYCLEHLWTHLKNIHREHSGLQQVSYSGPPIGSTIIKQEQVKVIENYFLDLTS